MADQTSTSVQTIRRKLGRGLGSLISAPVRVDIVPRDTQPNPAMTPPKEFASPKSLPLDDVTNRSIGNELVMLDLHSIHPNARQPRQHFDEDSLRSLAASIASSGMMQPIVVRPQKSVSATRFPDQVAEMGGYQIIAGERRWRAAQLAGLKQIPAIIREVDDRTAAELSLIENIQREDLNPMERAEAFQSLIDEFQLTHNDIADRVGLDRSSVTNHLRLKELDDFAKDALRAGRLNLGHGKALLAITNIEQRSAMAGLAVRHAWSVRELERRARSQIADGLSEHSAAPSRKLAPVPLHMADLQRRLGEHLGTKVRVQSGRTKGSGRLIINFYSLDQFEGLMRRLQFESD